MGGCIDITRIKDINDKYDYTDKANPHGRDPKLLSCGQSEGYNELQRVYRRYYFAYTEESVAKAMCEFCNKHTPATSTHERFHTFMKGKGFIKSE